MVRGNLAGRKRSVRTALAGLLAGLVMAAVSVVPAGALSADNQLEDLTVYAFGPALAEVNIGPGVAFSGGTNSYTLTSVAVGYNEARIDATPPAGSYVEWSTDGIAWEDYSFDDTADLSTTGTNYIFIRVSAEDPTTPRNTYVLRVVRGSGSLQPVPDYDDGIASMTCKSYDEIDGVLGTALFSGFSTVDYTYSNASNPIILGTAGDAHVYCNGLLADGDATIDIANSTGAAPGTFDGWETVHLSGDGTAFEFDSYNGGSGLINFDAQGFTPQYFWIRVSTPNGSEVTYQVEIFVETSGSDSSLFDLELRKSGGQIVSLAPGFDPMVEDYAATTNQGVIRVLAERNDSNAGIQIKNDSLEGEGEGWASIEYLMDPVDRQVALQCGLNELMVRVSAADGTDTIYVIDVTQTGCTSEEESSNADLSGLVCTSCTLSPAFDPSTTSYTSSVASGVSSVSVTPTVADAGASIQVRVNGGSYSSVNSGASSGALALNVGVNTVNVKVTAADDTVRTYTLTITRGTPLSNNANLSNLVCNSCTLTPGFSSGTTTYSSTVANSTSSVTVTPTRTDAGATIEVNVNGLGYTGVTSGTASGALALNVGANPINVKVTAEDGTVKTYTLTVTRQGVGTLGALVVTKANGKTVTLTPSFASSTFAYSGKIGYAGSPVTVTATRLDTVSTITVSANGASPVSVSSGVASSALNLNVGTNTIIVKVTAGSTVSQYTLTIERKAKPCMVKDVTGLKLSTAKQRLKKNGCSWTIVRVASSSVELNRIISQTPKGGVKRPAGFKVKLVVSNG